MNKQERKLLLSIPGQIKVLEEQLKELEMSTSIDYSNPLVDGGEEKNKLEQIVLKREELRNEIQEKVYELLELRLKVFKEIEKLPSPYMDIMFDRYINCKKWEDVARDQNYELRYILKLHKKAISYLL